MKETFSLSDQEALRASTIFAHHQISTESTLEELFENNKVDLTKKIIYVYLILLARYPSQSEIESFLYINKDFSSLFNEIKTTQEYLSLSKSKQKYQLIKANKNTLFIDVSHSSKYPLNTGIQRVVRCLCNSLLQNQSERINLFSIENDGLRPVLVNKETFINWERKVVFDSSGGLKQAFQNPKLYIFRTLKEIYSKSKFFEPIKKRFEQKFRKLSNELLKQNQSLNQTVILFDSENILLPEIAQDTDRNEVFYPLLCKNTEISLNLILYDLIPLTHPNLCPDGVVTQFPKYLSLLKYCKKISAISNSVAEQGRCFIKAFYDDKNAFPDIKAHLLAGLKKEEVLHSLNSSAEPLIISVSTIEPRKNQISILKAAQLLWDEGLKFRLEFIGAYGWKADGFLSELKKTEKHYPVKYLKHVDEKLLKEKYNQAKFTVFTSFVEGFGLPILESLSKGTPCICSNRGSMKEIAEQAGGCMQVDPDSVAEISQAMKILLTDTNRYSELKKQAENVTWHSWDDYANELFRYFSQES